MTEKTDPLLIGLRDRFARAVHGGDRARTATFINPHLQELGQCEWMEGYSLNNGQDWALKRMVLSSENGDPVVQQIQQDRYSHISFGEMLYRLHEYERGQDALGYLRDKDDSGHAVGTPLFLDVAAVEGIPHDASGSLVIPQNGHIVGDGKFPLSAFAIAASTVQRKKDGAGLAVAMPPQSVAMCLSDEKDIFTMTDEVKAYLFNVASRISSTVSDLRKNDMKGRFFENGSSWPDYQSLFEERYCYVATSGYTEKMANTACEFRSQAPVKIGSYVFAMMSAAELLCDRILYADFMQEKDSLRKVKKKHEDVVERHFLGMDRKINISPFDVTADLFVKSVKNQTFDRALECEKMQSIVAILENMARSVAIDLNSIPEDVNFALGDEGQRLALTADNNAQNMKAIPPYVGAGPG
ncbi:hypothetical protein [Micavibrio aeruginosavorus]|uniref:hypothetical protein n=1 Tax=Micavibrio aeruginosavorus TaxID=349221 RepID=UPI003F4A9250